MVSNKAASRPSGLFFFFIMVVLSQAVIFMPVPEPLKTGGLLLVWGFFLLVRLVHIGRPEGLGEESGKKPRLSLPTSILANLQRANVERKESNLVLVSHPALLLVFVLGAAYMLAGFWKAVGADEVDYVAMTVTFKMMLCGMGFWLAQGYALEARSALQIMRAAAVAGGLALGVSIYLMPQGGESALLHRVAELGVIVALLPYAVGVVCGAVYIRAIWKRRQHRSIAIFSLVFLIFTALVDYGVAASESLWAFWLVAWAVLGAGWAQAWPRSRRRYRIFQGV